MAANRFAQARRAAGFHSQRAFAKALDVSRGLVGQWESGTKMPGRDNLANIAALCAVSMAYLAGKSADPMMSITTRDDDEVDFLLAVRRMPPRARAGFAEFLIWLNGG
jgi:transcriptional regulator with XRE-family HTH domain